MNFKTHELKFDEHGFLPAVVQDASSREVLTLAYMNAESLQRTIETNETWFWSRSRNQLWHKGETSGNIQRVVDVFLDCDQDALVVLVEPAGPACHTGQRSCFHNTIDTDHIKRPEPKVPGPGAAAERPSTRSRPGRGETGTHDLGGLLDQLYALIETRKRERPAGSYTSYLFSAGLDKILKKLGEESAETIIAAKNPGSEPLVAETSDLLYHLLVLLVERGITLNEIRLELTRRQEKKGA
jgi:phosphoribosyl-ATP pyrophosphohydrolase/phosphoribosyl-AMP cyclohydrolase